MLYDVSFSVPPRRISSVRGGLRGPSSLLLGVDRTSQDDLPIKNKDWLANARKVSDAYFA